MIKRQSLQDGSRYTNALGEQAFVGSRIEGNSRVSTLQFEVPFTVDPTSCVCTTSNMVKVLTKISVPTTTTPAQYNLALEKALDYLMQELPDTAGYPQQKVLAAGAIEWTIEDL